MKDFKTMGDLQSDMYAQGIKMGFAKGGKVVGKMDSMDHGVQPAKEGTSEQEKEAGGTKRLKPGYEEGGSVAHEPSKENPYKSGTARHRRWAAKYGKKKAVAKKAKSKKRRNVMEKLANRSKEELEKRGYNEGGEVEDEGHEDEAMDKGVVKKAITKHEKTAKPRGHGMRKGGKPVHKSKPMFGKGGRSC